MSEIQITPEEMIQSLSGKNQQAAAGFIDLAVSLGCKPEVRPAAKTMKCVYSKKKPKRALLTLECGKDLLRVKANLFNIEQYQQAVENSSDVIKQAISSARDCTTCNTRCKGGTKFTLGGQDYSKCTGSSFFFSDMQDKDWDNLKALIELENNF